MVCPIATRDLKVNTKNRDSSIKAKHIQYGPINLEDDKYWVDLAEHWNTTPEVAKQSKCSNCVAFDISPRMEDCMPLEGDLGYVGCIISNVIKIEVVIHGQKVDQLLMIKLQKKIKRGENNELGRYTKESATVRC